MSVGWVAGAVVMGALATADGSPGDQASAGPQPIVDGDTIHDPANDRAIAELVELAARQFDQRTLGDASETLLKAIALSPRPRLFYNLAQVYRAAGNCAAARDGYREFLARAGAADPTRDRAQRWVREMQACVDRTAAQYVVNGATGSLPAGPPQPAPVPAPALVAVSRAPSPSVPPVGLQIAAPSEPVARTSRASTGRVVGWSLIGAGVLVEIGALMFQLEAKSVENDLPRAATRADYDRLVRQGEHDARWALWSAVADGALGGAGGGLLLYPSDRSATPTHTAFLGWGGGF